MGMKEKWYALKIQGQISGTTLYTSREAAEKAASVYGWVEVVEVDFYGNPT